MYKYIASTNNQQRSGGGLKLLSTLSSTSELYIDRLLTHIRNWWSDQSNHCTTVQLMLFSQNKVWLIDSQLLQK